jgi:DNA-directed RNA polymerase subunit RPC12/RpoP
MKAIVCPQCGGLIDDVSETKTIAKCGYCGARVLIERAEKPQPAPLPPPVHDTLHIPLENYRPFDDVGPLGGRTDGDAEEFTVEEPAKTTIVVVGTIGVAILFVVVLGYIGAIEKRPKQDFTSTPPAPYRTATPYQPLNVEPVTNADATSLPKPVIPKNLKIARRMDVEVYVSVDEQGNVYDATANTDNQALAKITVEAARRAKFRPSPTNQRTSGLLVYTIGPQ